MPLKPLDEKAALPDEPVSVSRIEDVDVRVVEDVALGEDTSATTSPKLARAANLRTGGGWLDTASKSLEQPYEQDCVWYDE
jgi:hypothetical protein